MKDETIPVVCILFFYSLELFFKIFFAKSWHVTFGEETVDVFVERTNRLKENVLVEFRDVDVIEGASFKDRSGNVAIVRENEEFAPDYSIGDIIYVNNESYEIIGITDETGETFPGLYFPETLREKIYANKSSASGIFNLVVKDGYSLDVVRTQVLELLNEDLDNTMKFVDFTEEIDKDIKESIGSVTIFLALIGTISLIVAGINVVNIMYISALEKMNEVAVCRALGMRKRTVIILFLMEAFVLVALFAVFGYLFGILTASVILVIMDIPIKLSFLHILLVLFISFVLGIGAGIKPAINAANANPASLLR